MPGQTQGGYVIVNIRPSSGVPWMILFDNPALYNARALRRIAGLLLNVKEEDSAPPGVVIPRYYKVVFEYDTYGNKVVVRSVTDVIGVHSLDVLVNPSLMLNYWSLTKGPWRRGLTRLVAEVIKKYVSLIEEAMQAPKAVV